MGKTEGNDGPAGSAGALLDPRGQPGPHTAEREPVEPGNDFAEAKGQPGEEPKRQLRVGGDGAVDRRGTEEEAQRRLHRGGGGGIGLAGKEGDLAERSPGALDVDHLTAPHGLAQHPYPPVEHHQQTPRRVTGTKECFAGLETPFDSARAQYSQRLGVEPLEKRNPVNRGLWDHA